MGSDFSSILFPSPGTGHRVRSAGLPYATSRGALGAP
jgi:hypothetical protein